MEPITTPVMVNIDGDWHWLIVTTLYGGDDE